MIFLTSRLQWDMDEPFAGGVHVPLGIQSPKLRMVMEPEYLAFWGWFYTPCSSSDVRWARIPRVLRTLVQAKLDKGNMSSSASWSYLGTTPLGPRMQPSPPGWHEPLNHRLGESQQTKTWTLSTASCMGGGRGLIQLISNLLGGGSLGKNSYPIFFGPTHIQLISKKFLGKKTSAPSSLTQKDIQRRSVDRPSCSSTWSTWTGRCWKGLLLWHYRNLGATSRNKAL